MACHGFFKYKNVELQVQANCYHLKTKERKNISEDEEESNLGPIPPQVTTLTQRSLGERKQVERVCQDMNP